MDLTHDRGVLRTLIISSDMSLVWTVEPTLRQLEFAMDVKPTIADGMEKLRYQPYCAVVVDCAAGSLQQVQETRELWLKRDPVVIAVAGRAAEKTDGLANADAVWSYPLLPEEMHKTLLKVRAKMLGDRRLQRRYAVDRATFLRYSYDGEQFFQAMIVDITETGVAVEGVETLVAGRAVQVQFTLPAMLSPIETLADVVWRTDEGRAGLRFLQMPQQQHRQLERWLQQARQGLGFGYSYVTG